LSGSLGLWLLWQHRLDPQPWLAYSATLLLAYLAPIVFDNTVGHFGVLRSLNTSCLLPCWRLGSFTIMNRSLTFHPSNLSSVFALSLIIAGMMTVLSLVGLLFPMTTYPSEDLRQSFIANDVVNLVFGLPILLGALWLARSGKLPGLLGLPGVLFYITYSALAYAAAMPLTWPFFIHLALAGLCAVAIFLLLSRLDGAAVQARLQGRVAERFGAGVLIGFGALFFLRAVGEFFDGAAGMAEFGVLVADLLTTPFWILGGLYLWRKQPLGYVSGAGLLFQASMLFVGLLVFFILQPFVAGVPFAVDDFVVIAVMSLLCFIPFGMFARGVMK
jgi:hypothetical protein